jgi:hypothetical protein
MTTVSMTRVELLTLAAGIDALQQAQNGSGPVTLDCKTNYAVAKTKRLITAEVEATREVIAPLPAFLAYEQARIALCREHAEKDDAGQAKTTACNGQVSFVMNPEARSVFDAALITLRTEYAEAIEAQTDHQESIGAFLHERLDVEIHRVGDAAVPALAPAIYDALFPLFDETE